MHGGCEFRPDPIAVARWVRRRYRVSTPVDTVSLARRMGLRVEYARLPAHRPGYLIRCEPDLYVILINRRDGIHRRNWTCAHEQGHYIMHRDLQFVHAFSPDDRGSNHRLIEREANRFAAELLMPASEVRELAPTMCFLSLAAHFGVSRQAMHLRLLEMNM